MLHKTKLLYNLYYIFTAEPFSFFFFKKKNLFNQITMVKRKYKYNKYELKKIIIIINFIIFF